MYTLTKRFRFEAAHHLPKLPKSHKCHNVHGHSYEVALEISSDTLADEGWVIDFGEIATIAEPLVKELDHTCLNDIKGLENPTAEILSKWVWDRLKDKLPGLVSVEIAETCTAACRYSD